MGAANFMEEIDCGSFLDLIDFPSDDVLIDNNTFTDNVVGVHKNDVVEGYSFPNDVWSAHCQPLPNADLSAELSVPYEDIVQLEWLSNFVEDSFSGGSLTMKKEEYSSINKDSSPHQFHTSSPVSVLESSSSCSGEKTSPRSPEVVGSGRCGRARSKRPRPATFTPRLPMQLVSRTENAPHLPRVPSDSENFAESRLVIKIPRQVGSEQKRKKKIKITLPAAPVQNDQDLPPQQAVRKCLHCEITKTPQWRAGPMGPKTLCNACGVRYKSGRLFPEYRPAASPTFVPSLHSNSHKKVLEMRDKTGEKPPVAGAPAMVSKTPELIPNNSDIQKDYM